MSYCALVGCSVTLRANVGEVTCGLCEYCKVTAGIFIVRTLIERISFATINRHEYRGGDEVSGDC